MAVLCLLTNTPWPWPTPAEAASARGGLASDEQPSGFARPVKTIKQGGVEVSVWRNPGEQSDMQRYDSEEL
jgi:hypothetical protein